MKIVLALGMSSPLSMIVVASSMSNRCVDEIEHHLFQLALGHLAVADADARLGHDLLQPVGDVLDVVHAVVDEEDLPAAVQLPQHRRGGSAPSSNRVTRVSTASRSSGGVSRFEMSRSAQQRHVQRPRDRRGRHRQHVDRPPQRLEPLLDLDAEPLLLVDDHQPQVLRTRRRADASRWVPMTMSTAPPWPAARRSSLLLVGAEPAEASRSRTGTRPSAR